MPCGHLLHWNCNSEQKVESPDAQYIAKRKELDDLLKKRNAPSKSHKKELKALGIFAWFIGCIILGFCTESGYSALVDGAVLLVVLFL